jgi:hypothetical protein
MKIACLFAASALASVAPPRISLSLDGQYTDVDSENFPTTVGEMKSNVGKTCKAGIDDARTCKFPIASAWDHQDQKVAVQEQVWHIDSTMTAPTVLCNTEAADATACTPNLINYEEPGEYLFLYNAEDAHANKAKTSTVEMGPDGNKMSDEASVTFNLLIKDEVAPQICYGQVYSQAQLTSSNGALACQNGGFKSADPSSRVFVHQGGQADFMLRKSLAHDDITYPNQMPITYTIRTCTASEEATATTAPCSGPAHVIKVEPTALDAPSKSFNDMLEVINKYVNGDDRKVGYVQVAMDASDQAGIYGENGANNEAQTVYIAINVVDTVAPAITEDGGDEQYECGVDAEGYYNSVVDNTAAGAKYKEDMATPSIGDCMYGSAADICKTTTNLGDIMKTARFDKDSDINLDDKAYRVPGNYQVVYSAKDTANNQAALTRTITIVDTGAPSIQIENSDEVKYQSNVKLTREGGGDVLFNGFHGSAYSVPEGGVTVSDACDTHINHKSGGKQLPDSVSFAWDKPYNARQIGSYVKTYTVKDHAGHTASASRTYHVVDQEAPKITIEGEPIERFEANRDEEYKDDGARCADFVDGQLNHRVRVGGDIVDLSLVGTYHVKYTCTDLTGNPAVALQRTVIVEDSNEPTIHMAGQQTVKIEAGFPYSDAGATASDTLEGLYKDCGEVTADDKVVVGCSVIGGDGEPFVLSPAECGTNPKNPCSVDSTTGVVSPAGCDRKPVLVKGSGMNCLATYGDSINEYKAYQSMTSCAAIFASSPQGANSGSYSITVEDLSPAQEHIRFKTAEVSCDMDDAQNIPTFYYASESQTCDQLEGFKVLRHNTITARQQAFINTNEPHKAREYLLDGKICIADVTRLEQTLEGDNRIDDCKTMSDGVHACTVPRLSSSMSGTNYLITYSVTDHAGNAASKIRTVIVEDTLPPVISLHFKTKQENGDRAAKAYLIQQSAGGTSHADAEASNPAANKLYNPYLDTREVAHYKGARTGGTRTGTHILMAESTTSVNGWLIAAGVSAVAGMALLASSSQKTVTSVPV